MDKSSQSEAVLKLGKKIVDEFGLDQSVDTLGRWMAHYIAELMHDVEIAGANDKTSKSATCSAAILELWKHRNKFPNGKRPFEDFEPVLKALESLDPTDNRPRYFREIFNHAETEQGAKARKWLKVADTLDYSAKILIGYCLAQAAKSALHKSQQWVELAEAAGADNGGDFITIRFIKGESDLFGRTTKPKDTTRDLMQDRLDRLNTFHSVASELQTHLEARLKGFEKEKSQRRAATKAKKRKGAKRKPKA